MSPNGWLPEVMLPHPARYARLGVVHDGAEFRPQFDSILYSADPDFFIFNSRLRWWDARHFDLVTSDGCASTGRPMAATQSLSLWHGELRAISRRLS